MHATVCHTCDVSTMYLQFIARVVASWLLPMVIKELLFLFVRIHKADRCLGLDAPHGGGHRNKALHQCDVVAGVATPSVSPPLCDLYLSMPMVFASRVRLVWGGDHTNGCFAQRTCPNTRPSASTASSTSRVTKSKCNA